MMAAFIEVTMSLTSRPVYTANQIAAGAFFGGPIASTLMMRGNFIAFGDMNRAKNTLIYGLLSATAIFSLAFVLPKQVPNTALPIGYTVAFRIIAKQFGMEKGTLRSSGFHIRSNWRVAGISLLWFSVMMIVVFAAVFLFISIGQQVAHHQQ